jgi:cell division protein FtsA
MNNEKPYVVGLDIGSTKICAVAARESHQGQLEIGGLIEEPLDENTVHNSVIVNMEKAKSAIDKVLDTLSTVVKTDIGVVNVNISGEIVRMRKEQSTATSIDGQSMQEADLMNMARDVQRTYLSKNDGQTIIHCLPQEFTIDGLSTIDNPIGRIGVRFSTDFSVVTARSTHHQLLHNIIKGIRGKFKDAVIPEKMDINSVIFSPIADAMAVVDEKDKRSGIAVVNIGQDTTEIAIFHRFGLRHIAVLPYGGKTIDEDLERGVKVSYEYSEKLKMVCGLAPSDKVNLHEIITVKQNDGRTINVSVKNAAIIIEERLKEIAAMVVAEINRAGYGSSLSGGIILTGGLAKMPITIKAFEQVCKDFYIRVGNPNRYISNNKGFALNNPKYATVVGLTLAAIKRLDERVPASVLENTIEEYRVPRPVEPEPQPVAEVIEEEKGGSGGLFGMFRNFIKSSSPNDDHVGYT